MKSSSSDPAILAQIVTGHQADQGQIGAIVVPAAAILQKLMPRSAFVRKMIRVQVGQRLDIERLCQALISIGYERTRQVDGPGQLAQRGDIVDVVPAQPEDGRSAEGLRISFLAWRSIRLSDLIRKPSVPPKCSVKQLLLPLEI